jgi:hypothetical protein
MVALALVAALQALNSSDEYLTTTMAKNDLNAHKQYCNFLHNNPLFRVGHSILKPDRGMESFRHKPLKSG